jgi:hypothetical protein
VRVLLIQFQPHRAPDLDPERVTDLIARFVMGCPEVVSHHFSEGTDRVRWMNFQLKTRNLAALWSAVRKTVLADSEMGEALARSAMVLCQGEHEWDDYLVLHHFNPTEQLDTLG